VTKNALTQDSKGNETLRIFITQFGGGGKKKNKKPMRELKGGGRRSWRMKLSIKANYGREKWPGFHLRRPKKKQKSTVITGRKDCNWSNWRGNFLQKKPGQAYQNGQSR